MKKYIYPLALAATMITATACSDDEVVNDTPTTPVDQKEMIEFSMSDAGGVMSSSSMTRAGFTGGTNKDLTTQIVARISSTNGTATYHTRTVMTAQPDASANGGSNWPSYSSVSYSTNGEKRYWDDALGRLAKLSVYAIAVPNKTDQTNNSNKLEDILTEGSTAVSSVNTNWKSDTENNVISWKVTSAVTSGSTTTGQSATTLENEDLCYSNNIQAASDGGNNGRLVYGEHGASAYPSYSWEDHTTSCSHDTYKHDFYPTMDDGQMTFKLNNSGESSGPGHFDRGHMIFKHALIRITIDLIGGDGFDYTNSSSFTLQAQSTGCPASVDLLKMITQNKLNIQTGAWSTAASDYTVSDHTYMNCGSKASGSEFAKDKTIYTLAAQVIPGYKVTDGNTNNMMTFMIDGNNYYVTEDQIFDALNTTANTTANEADGSKKVNVVSNAITFEQGKNYHFTIKIGKTKIDALTCTLVNWVDVTGSFAATNAFITFNSLKTDVNDCEHFDLYRVLNVNNTVTDPTHTNFDGTPQYMTGYASDSNPVRDMLSTDGSGAGVTEKTAGTSATSKIWQTTWFFDNNKSFYHFRTVNPGVTITKEESAGKGDYFTMYSGPVNDDYPSTGTPDYPTSVIGGNETAKYNDYHWGALFTPSTTAGFLNYSSTTGFQSQLTGPVGPTQSTLNLTEQHMMSNIRVVLLTPINDDSTYPTDAVELYNAANTAPRKVSVVKITNFAGDATVRMGNGLITPSTTYVSKEMTTPDATTEWSTTKGNPDTDYCTSKTFTFTGNTQKYYATQPYTYRIVPQSLSHGSTTNDKVGITIQTPDDNMYYVVQDLSAIKPSSVSGNALKGDHAKDSGGNYSAITRWYPGYTYTYYFVVKKTGIQLLTCTIVDWVKVDAEKIDITLEN